MAYTAWHDFASGETLTDTLMDAIVANMQALFPVGVYAYMARSATTSETLVSGVWLECNAVSVLRATYPDLNTLLSGLSYPFGTVDGTHMTLPDAQGRSLVSMASGGHTNVNAIGDSDGVAKASRNPKETVAGSVGAGTASGTITGGSVTVPSNGTVVTGAGVTAGSPGTFSLTGATFTSGTTTGGTFSGSALAGSYVVGGTLFIKAVA